MARNTHTRNLGINALLALMFATVIATFAMTERISADGCNYTNICRSMDDCNDDCGSCNTYCQTL